MSDRSSARGRSVQARVNLPRIPEVTLPGLRERYNLDLLLVNPPSPNKDPYIRDIHRVGRNSREGTIWPQTALAQLAAMFPETMSLRVVDCIAERMTWPQFEQYLLATRPRYYVTQATAPTITNDMRGVFLAKALGAVTMAVGTHVSPATVDTLTAYPALDFVLRGEPELTLVELIAALESANQRISESANRGISESGNQGIGESGKQGINESANRRMDELVRRWERLFREADPDWQPAWEREDMQHATRNTYHASRITPHVSRIEGIAYRHDGQVVINPDRPFIADLDTLPIPRHELLPLERYKLPLVGGRYTFVVTSRGCPGGCRFCIKHVTYQETFRFRSPEHIMREVWKLVDLGTTNIHFEADLFTINREQVVGLCQAIREQKPPIRWTCNSRVDFVDEELLQLMGQAGCWLIAWGIESGSPEILQRARKGIALERVEETLRWSKAAGIRNWGYFILGLPGETAETIEQTIAFSKKLPLDLVLFHIAVPYPGTPFWYEALDQGWLRLQRWEDFDMYNSTVVEYPHLTAEQIARAARRAAREWSLRPGPLWTFVKELRHPETLRQWLQIGARYLSWIVSRD